jgi:hypothetical protein
MIPFEELAAALDDYAARISGEAAPAPSVHARSTAEPPTAETALPPTHASGPPDDDEPEVSHVAEDHSNELDIGDVLADEEPAD